MYAKSFASVSQTDLSKHVELPVEEEPYGSVAVLGSYIWPDAHDEVCWCHFEGRTDRFWRCQVIPDRYGSIVKTI